MCLTAWWFFGNSLKTLRLCCQFHKKAVILPTFIKMEWWALFFSALSCHTIKLLNSNE